MPEGSRSVESDSSDNRVDNVKLQLSDFYDREHASIDANHNGFLDDKELSKSLYSGKYKGNDAKLNELLLENYNDVQALNNDDWGREYRGVSSKDMSKLSGSAGSAIIARMEKSVNADEHDRSKLPNLIGTYKGKIDKDGSGDFSKSELKDYIQTSGDRPAAINAAAFVHDHFDELKGLRSARSHGAYADVLPGDYKDSVFGSNDLKSLNHALLPQQEFQKLLDAGRSVQIASGISEILFGALLAKENKHSDFGKAVGNYHRVNGTLKSVDIATDKLLLQEYKDRQKMIDSWKYFKH